MKILAFSAKKQGGKTTAVNHLASQWSCGWEIIGFFSFAKEIIRRCFGVVGNQDLQEIKERTLACGSTVRELQQWLGSDIFRGIDKDCWINAYKSLVEDTKKQQFPPTNILTPDVRFPNEVKCVQEMGGHVIRLLRAPFPEDRHESETALDGMERETQLYYGLLEWTEDEMTYSVPVKGRYLFDAIIDNREMTIAEQNEAVWKLVTERKWI